MDTDVWELSPEEQLFEHIAQGEVRRFKRDPTLEVILSLVTFHPVPSLEIVDPTSGNYASISGVKAVRGFLRKTEKVPVL